MSPIKLGISACLVGEKVRYDGGHSWDRFITDTLGRHLEFVPVCPEAECGLGVPREPMRLVGGAEAPRLLTVRTGLELTERLQTWTGRKLAELASEDLAGFIFKSKSPSCGPARVKLYNDQGRIAGRGAGLFARACLEQFPLLPVADESQLYDPEIRENFIERLFFWQRWRELLTKKPDRGDLVAFHTRHKYQLLAHSTEHYRQMGPWVARGESWRCRSCWPATRPWRWRPCNSRPRPAKTPTSSTTCWAISRSSCAALKSRKRWRPSTLTGGASSLDRTANLD